MGNFFDKFLNLVILAFACIIIHYTFFTQPGEPSDVVPDLSSENISFQELNDPIQKKYRGNDYIPYVNQKVNLKIFPKAEYKVYATVMGKKRYRWGWESKLAPYDLALVWNKLMLPENQKGIKYSQGNRWYYYRYNNDYPLSGSYIAEHSANNHIIPANDNLRKAIDRIRVMDNIYLEGYLVYIDGKVNNRKVWWKSSLSRNDSGDGACEVFYITKAILGDEVYQ